MQPLDNATFQWLIARVREELIQARCFQTQSWTAEERRAHWLKVTGLLPPEERWTDPVPPRKWYYHKRPGHPYDGLPQPDSGKRVNRKPANEPSPSWENVVRLYEESDA
jgi:hypothetical protein